MEFIDVIKKRKSNRQYNSKPVPEKVLNKLYEALQIAPTGSNKQDFKFIFVTDAKKRALIADKACNQEFIKEAQVLVIATCKKDTSFNVAIAIDHMILEATNQGLGSCWIGWFDGEKTRPILNIPKDVEIPIMVTIGYTDESPKARPRKSLDELIGKNTY